MSTLGDAGLAPDGRAVVDAALSADPALAEELEAIALRLTPDARGTFWRAFADGCMIHERSAAAVLAALEAAAGIRGGR
jgi:hypothetical protein